MKSFSSVGSKLAVAAAFFACSTWAQMVDMCSSFGVDFQNAGSYFQNSNSAQPFTFVSTFTGCMNDVATNLFVDPNGNEIMCSTTPLLPDNTAELSTCMINKNQLVSGDYSILILSNNGNGTPIAYERDFSLSVGPQQTTTFTPTVTVLTTTTPIYNTSSITTTTSTITLDPSTITSASITLSPTTTVTPNKVTVTTSKAILTLPVTKYQLSVVQTTKTKTATCSIPPTQPTPDPTCKITPTLVTAAALSTGVSAKFRRVLDRRVPVDREQRIKERKERMAKLQKRAPDMPTITVTDTNTADFVTTTSTSTAPTLTVTMIVVSTVTAKSTPPAITVLSGTTALPQVTITAATPTKTRTIYYVATTVVTKTLTQTVTIQTTTTPAAASTACVKSGGHMHNHHLRYHNGKW